MVTRKFACFFTVVIPVFNRVFELERSLRSVIAQSFSDFECIVVDDGSIVTYQAAIQNLIASLDDRRISLVINSVHKNGSVARNVGISLARGRYISFLDSDDEWHTSKLQRVHDFIVMVSPTSLVYHRYVNSRDGVWGKETPASGIRLGQTAAQYQFITNRYGEMQTSCITVESSAAKEVLFDPTLPAHQDWDFVLRFNAQFQHLDFLAEVLTIRHIKPLGGDMVSRSISHNYSLEFLKKMRGHFSLLARVAYARNILIYRYFREFPFARWSVYHAIAFVVYPGYCVPVLFRWIKTLIRLKKLKHKLSKSNARCVALFGFNDYSERFVSLYAAQFDRVILLDRNADPTGQRVLINRLDELNSNELNSIDAFALMTDKHRTSMFRDLSSKSIESSKVFYF